MESKNTEIVFGAEAEHGTAEEKLHQTEAILNSIFRVAPIGVVKDRVLISANKYWCELFGYAENSIIGKNTRQFFENEEEWLRVGKELYEISKKNGSGSAETRLRCGDGSFRDVVLASASIAQNDLSAGIVVIVYDITERKKIERGLYESERKHREFIDNVNSIILRWTCDGRVTFLNKYGQQFFGYSLDEIIGRHVMGTIVPAVDSNGRELGQLMEQILSDPAAFEKNINENMRRNGERVWISWNNKIFQHENGFVEILSVGSDVTDRKEMMERLRESESRLSSILNNVSDIVFSLAVEPNDHFRFNLVNRRFQEATGLPASRVVGLLVRDVIPEASHDLVFKKYREAVQSGLPVHWEEESEYSTGKKIGHVTVVPVFDDRGVCYQLVGMVHDITEIKKAEQSIRELNMGLEQRVTERTAELAEAKVRAEAADNLKSAFLANMSHELRTPLNSIIGFTGIILQGLAGPLNEEQNKQLKMVRDSARHLLALINDVLDISKIEAGQLNVSCEIFDLRALIEKVAGIVMPLLDKKDLVLHMGIAPEIGSLVSDSRRVEQVLLNLLNNAIKFTEQGTVTLKAETIRGTVSISVADTGIGIKNEDLIKLFQPFRQIDSGLSRQREGTGLGLAISRRLAELLGGEIHVSSEFGKGSVFTFELPLK